jgi:hypothetical protein
LVDPRRYVTTHSLLGIDADRQSGFASSNQDHVGSGPGAGLGSGAGLGAGSAQNQNFGAEHSSVRLHLRRRTSLTSRFTTETLMDLEDPASTRPVTSTKTPTSTSLPVPVDPLLVELPTPTSSTPTDRELLATRTVLPTATLTSNTPRAGRVPVVLEVS